MQGKVRCPSVQERPDMEACMYVFSPGHSIYITHRTLPSCSEKQRGLARRWDLSI